MLIDVSHRENIKIHTKDEYLNLYNKCVNYLKEINTISSIILCGSLAKNDIVEGWSDIDIVIFTSSAPDICFLQKFKSAMENAKEGFCIPLGMDIVFDEEFKNSNRFSGRPLMMTYEVATYGILSYGKDYLSPLKYDNIAMNLVNIERKKLIAAEMHSWRRQYINNTYNISNTFFNTTKALLRILQTEVGPNLELPINNQRNLERFKIKYGNHPSVETLEKAVFIRKNWQHYVSNPTEMEVEIETLSEALTTYPVFYAE